MPSTNKTLLITQPGGDHVMLVIAIVLDPQTLDIERLLSGMVPEMARGGVRAGLLVVGDSTLVLRATGDQIEVDEVDTGRLLSVASIDTPWSRANLLQLMQRWVSVMAREWRDRLEGELRELLVPHAVAGLAGDLQVCDGIWGMEAHRVVAPSDEP